MFEIEALSDEKCMYLLHTNIMTKIRWLSSGPRLIKSHGDVIFLLKGVLTPPLTFSEETFKSFNLRLDFELLEDKFV